MQDFSVGVHFAKVGKNFTIGRIHEIWGNFSKILIKLLKIKNY